MIKVKRKNKSGSNNEHALLGPSGSERWINCAASLVVTKDIPNESGQAAINGTTMHTVAEVVLNRIIKGEKDITPKTYKGAYVPDEGRGKIQALVKPVKGAVLITDDMVKQVGLYVDHWRTLLDVADFVRLEMRADLTKVLHPGATLPNADGEEEEVKTFGTADMVMVVPRTDGTYMLIVGDLKTGRHKVEAYNNKQLMLYALGLMRKLATTYEITMVRLVIFQPYCGGASEWDIEPLGLETFGKFASKGALKALDAMRRGKKGLKKDDFHPVAAACEWCRFADQCAARNKASIATLTPPTATGEDLGDVAPAPSDREARRAARKARKAKKAEPGAMTIEELAAAYSNLDMMRQQIKNIEAAVFKAVLAGDGKALGLKMVAGKEGNRKWGDADAALEVLTKARVKRDLVYKETLISPTDAEKVFKDEKPKVWEKLQVLVERAPAKPTLAPIDDPRPEWQDATDEDLNDE